MFPLLITFVTILGFVLQGDPGEIHSVERVVLDNFPGLGQMFKFSAVHGNVVVPENRIRAAMDVGLLDPERLVAELDLAEGTQVWLSAKATEVDLYPEPNAPTGNQGSAAAR